MRFQNNIGHLIIQKESLMGLEQIVVLVQAVKGKVIGFFSFLASSPFPRRWYWKGIVVLENVFCRILHLNYFIFWSIVVPTDVYHHVHGRHTKPIWNNRIVDIQTSKRKSEKSFRTPFNFDLHNPKSCADEGRQACGWFSSPWSVQQQMKWEGWGEPAQIPIGQIHKCWAILCKC